MGESFEDCCADDLSDTAGNQQSSSVEDHDPRARLLHLGQGVCAEDDGRPLPSYVAYQVEDLGLTGGVESEGRLVEKDDGRVVHQCPGNAETLTHAAAVTRDRGISPVSETHLNKQFPGQSSGALAAPAVEAGVVAQIFTAGLRAWIAAALGKHADSSPDLGGRRPGLARYPKLAAGRCEHSGKEPNRRCLACTVGPQQSHDLARLGREAEVFDGAAGSVSLGESDSFQRDAHHLPGGFGFDVTRPAFPIIPSRCEKDRTVRPTFLYADWKSGARV